nr:hypothetical protein [Tanacetum cinerariifolium]
YPILEQSCKDAAVTNRVPVAATRDSGRLLPDTVQLETAISTISQEYLLEFTSEFGISEDLHPKLPGPEERIVNFSEGKVKTGTRLCAAHEVPLLTVTASRVLEIEDPATTTDSFGVPSTIERGRPSGGDYCHGSSVIKKRRKRGNDGVDTNAPPKVLRIDHVDSRPTQSAIRGKSIAAIWLGMGSTFCVPTSQYAPIDDSDPGSLSFANPQSIPTENVAQSSKGVAVAGDPKSKNTFFTSMVGSPESIYHPEWKQYNINLTWQVAMGSQLRLRFKQEANLLKKSVAQVAHWDQRIQARQHEIKNLEALLEAETGMKKTTEAKNAELGKDLENLRALFSDLQVSNDRLSQQVSTLQAQVTGEKKLKVAFEEFKQYKDGRVEKRCAKMDERLDALRIDFDEELYPHMLTSITGIAKGMSEGHKYGVEHGKANLDLEAIEAYDSEADTKYVAALHALRDISIPWWIGWKV